MIKLVAVSAAAVVMAAALAMPAAAQTRPMMGMMGGGCPMMGMMMGQGPGQGPGGQGMRMPGMGGPGAMGRMARMDALVAGRLAYLKGELQITEAQSKAWDAYAEAVEARVDAMQSMRQNMLQSLQDGSATDRLDARIAAMETMLEAMKAVRPTIEELYAILSDEQKTLADELIGVDCGAM